MENDVTIIGGGLSGLLTGHFLSKKGFLVTLCEAQDKLGGNYRVDTAQGVLIDYGLHLNVLTSDIEEAHLPIEWIQRKATPFMLQKMSWTPIDINALSTEQKMFAHGEYCIPKGGVGKLVQHLSQNLKIELSQPIQNCVVEDSQIKKIIGNKKEWEAKAFVTAIPSKAIFSLLGHERINPQWLKKLKQEEAVSALKLDFILKAKVFEGDNVLFLPECNGVGFFPSNIDESISDGDYQISQWIFFLNQEEFLNNEIIAKKLKAGKRFILKAFPDFFEKVIWERMTLIEALFSKKQETIKEWTTLKNVFCAGELQKIESFLSSR